MIENGKLVKTLTEMVTSFFQGIVKAVAQENREETRSGHSVPRLRVEALYLPHANLYLHMILIGI